MGDYYGYGANSNNGGNVPNFSVPPPSFQNGPSAGGQNYQQNNYGAPPQQQGNNWGPPNAGRGDNSHSYGSGGGGGGGGGNYQSRNNPPGRGGGNYGNNPRNDYGGDRKNNFSGGSGNKSGYNKGDSGSDSNMVIQEDTIFVSGMSVESTEDDIANHFGAIGIIKKDKKTGKPKIWLYRNKETGESKGEATITYDDSNAAQSAISWFDQKNFDGATINVSLAQRQNTWQRGGGGRGGSRGGGNRGPPGGGNRGGFDRDNQSRGGDSGGFNRDDDRGGRGSQGGGNRNQREGDWTCSGCNNTNFAWRNECNRCKEPKSGGGSSNSNNGSSGYRSGQNQGRSGPPNQRSGGGGGGGDFNRRDQGPMRGGDRPNGRNRPY